MKLNLLKSAGKSLSPSLKGVHSMVVKPAKVACTPDLIVQKQEKKPSTTYTELLFTLKIQLQIIISMIKSVPKDNGK